MDFTEQLFRPGVITRIPYSNSSTRVYCKTTIVVGNHPELIEWTEIDFNVDEEFLKKVPKDDESPRVFCYKEVDKPARIIVSAKAHPELAELYAVRAYYLLRYPRRSFSIDEWIIRSLPKHLHVTYRSIAKSIGDRIIVLDVSLPGYDEARFSLGNKNNRKKK